MSSVRIAQILSEIDPMKYMHIISRAINNGYHDFKFDKVPNHPEYAETICPKMQLVEDLNGFPELGELRLRVINGEFDDDADDLDQVDIMGMLLDENVPDVLIEHITGKIPTEEERQLRQQQKRYN